MQTLDEKSPHAGAGSSLARVEDNNLTMNLTPQQMDDIRASLRLAVGSALSGRDAYIQRLRQVQAAQEAIRPENVVVDANETSQDQLRYLLLGILFETPEFVQRSLATADRVSSKAFGLVSRVLSPVTNSRIFRPVKNQFNYAASRGEELVDRLMMTGRIEEQNSRMILQQENIDNLVNDVLEYVILKTDALQIVQEGGVSVAVDMTDEFREQSATVDSLLEQKLKSLFRRRRPSQPDAPRSDLGQGG